MAFTIPYRAVFGPQARPYLIIHLTGPNGGPQGPAIGIVDSGADSTSLPYGFAQLMGYTESMLEEEEFGSANGSVTTGYKALVPCTGIVPEIPDVVVEMLPLFVKNTDLVLWGRADFMAKFDVTFQEHQQQFTLTPCE